jgi:hypothetical protein
MTQGSSLRCFRRSVYSQSGEDGILQEIFRRLGRRSGWFCEFGAWDGRYGSNSYNLLLNGWSGVMIEGHPARYRRLEALGRRFNGRLHTLHAMVSYEPSDRDCLDNLLKRTAIPTDFDLLSIDVDGYDFQIWDATKAYRPAIVVIEINSAIAPGPEVLHDEGGNGSSFTAMLALAHAKRYVLAAHTGNMIFVRSDLIDLLGLPRRELENPEELFISDWIAPTRYSVARRKLRFLTRQRLALKIDNLVRERLDA